MRLDAFRLVLVGPRTSGNVGACARVATNFECADWVIADARCSWDEGQDARKYAMGPAAARLDSARAVATVAEAVGDCQAAVGFTRRFGKTRKPTVALAEIVDLTRAGRVALVFGNEETGLSTQELSHCTHLCMLDTADEMPSMNLSHAVAVVLARVYEQLGAAVALRPSTQQRLAARVGELDAMMAHWRELLGDIGMVYAGNPNRMTTTLRRIFYKTQLTPRDIRALRAMISKTQVALGVRSRGKRITRMCK